MAKAPITISKFDFIRLIEWHQACACGASFVRGCKADSAEDIYNACTNVHHVQWVWRKLTQTAPGNYAPYWGEYDYDKRLALRCASFRRTHSWRKLVLLMLG